MGLWGGRGATLAVLRTLESEVEGRLRALRAAGRGSQHPRVAHDEQRAGALAARNRPCLASPHPSWPGAAESTNRVASCAVFTFPLEGGGDVSWLGPRFLFSQLF